MIEAILYVATITVLLFLIGAGMELAWALGWKWGRVDAERKWKKERGLLVLLMLLSQTVFASTDDVFRAFQDDAYARVCFFKVTGVEIPYRGDMTAKIQSALEPLGSDPAIAIENIKIMAEQVTAPVAKEQMLTISKQCVNNKIDMDIAELQKELSKLVALREGK